MIGSEVGCIATAVEIYGNVNRQFLQVVDLVGCLDLSHFTHS